jgi:hypothetical protein
MCSDEEFEKIKSTGSDFSSQMKTKILENKKKAGKIVENTEKRLRSLLL